MARWRKANEKMNQKQSDQGKKIIWKYEMMKKTNDFIGFNSQFKVKKSFGKWRKQRFQMNYLNI